ncbi:MAG: PHP domain-containing protein [Planctomycetota bacterium]
MSFCDLHMHSTASDGTDPPEALPRLVKDAGLTAFALTDHDTQDGLLACGAAAKRLRVGFIPGIELSVDPVVDPALAGSAEGGSDGEGGAMRRGTLHLLGYGIDPADAGIGAIRDRLRESRHERNPMILEKLAGLGVDVSYDEVIAAAGGEGGGGGGSGSGGQVVGRPHIAQVLVDKGYVRSVHEAFRRYIGVGAPAYARKDQLSSADAIGAINAAGGLAVLAHPVQLRLSEDELEHAVSLLVDQGLRGIETRHSDHRPEDTRRFEALAERFNLLPTGGSDYHGTRKSVELGQCRVPAEVGQRLMEALG